MTEEFIMFDFSKTCRTCLAQDNNMHPVNNSIKTAQNNNFVIKDMLLTCAQIQVSDDDGLPSQVCLKCVCRVSDAYIFKQNCEKSQNTLREYISNKLAITPSQDVQHESENCETFKDNVMNLINIAVDGANVLDQELIANRGLINKIENESEHHNENNTKSLNENIINNGNIHDTTMQLKISRKRRKIPKRINHRSDKVTKIAPKSSLNTGMPYNDHGKFITINISGNNVIIGDKPAKLTKLPENIEIKGQCKMCGIYFIYEQELKSHLKEVHSLNDQSDPIKYICHICNIEFPMFDELNEHNVLEHYKDAAHQCDECHNYYASKHILNRHKRFTHGKMVGEISCEICPKRFDSVRGLSIHKTFHNSKPSENKISCKICDRTFNVMSNLTYHMKYHKTDVCQYCNQGFCNTSMMKDHMKEVHSGDKPYHCSYCSKKFNIRKVLLKHKRIAHGVYDDIYFCGICKNNNVGFIAHEFLLKHIEKYHKLPQSAVKELPKDTSLRTDDSVETNHQNDGNVTANDPQASFINMQNMSPCEKVSNEENALCTKELSFVDNPLENSNLSQLIDLTNDVNSSQITLNDDGTINISINDAQVQHIQVSEVGETEENLISTQDFTLGEAIENTIKVLKEEIFNDNKIESNFSITEMGGYTINEINPDENNIEVNNLQDTTESSEQNLDFNDSLIAGKIIDYDEEKQQYTISYDGAEYIISANSLNQTNNTHFEAAEPENFNNSIDSNSNGNDDSVQSDQQIEENVDEDITNNLNCKLCNITFIDQTSYNNHVPKHNKAARGLDTLISQQESAVESCNDIKEGMIRINIDNVTGIVAHEKTDLIFAKEDYNSAPEVEENKVDVPRYRCPKCDDLFTRQYSLNRHLAHTHNELCLVCNTCGEGFNRVSLLEEHRLKHKNMLSMGVIITSVEKPATGNETTNETQNAIQEITESLYVYEPESQSFPCEFCDKTFQRQIYLERHRVMHLGINQPGFMCSTCNKIFLTAVDMQKHKRKHNEEYLQCNLCDRTFTTLGGLKYHLKTHTGNKNHKCPFCGKKFTANINLNAHIKTVHSEVKPHLCNICGKRYTTSDHLRKHMVYHTGERKFQCGVCGRDFTQNSHLTQHSWIHSGIKPYACKYCDNKYTSSSALKKHMHSHHRSS